MVDMIVAQITNKFMDDKELNQFIHEKVMKGCWHHNWVPHKEHPYPLKTCDVCGYTTGSMQAKPGAGVLNYCNDLNAASLAELTAIGEKGWKKYYLEIMGDKIGKTVHLAFELVQQITLSARNRMEAVYRMYAEEKQYCIIEESNKE